MKKILKYLLILFMFIPFMNLHAIDAEDVDYKIEKIYLNAEIEIAGGLRVKELIIIKGSLNGYVRDIYYEDKNLKDFDKSIDSFYSSKIYNASQAEFHEVGIGHKNINSFKEFNDTYVKENITILDKDKEKTYELKDEIEGYTTIKIYNETENDYAVFYMDYVVPNVVVEHTDVAEFYYPFIGKNFEDKINELYIQVSLPYKDENMKVWAHGPLSGEAFILSDKKGAALKVNDLYKTTTDLRIAYNKELFMINVNESKKSGVEGLPFILKVEGKKAADANRERKLFQSLYYGVTALSIGYIISLLYFSVYIYKKYDKEHESLFKQKYNREFIDDYPVECVEYLMNKSVSSKAFTASLLNLIYKKNIEVKKLVKKDYEFKLLSDKNTNENEKKLLNLLFEKIGNNSSVTMSQIKKESKNTSKSGANELYDGYMSWKNSVQADSNDLNFYENRTKIKTKFGLYSLIGGGLLFLAAYAEINPIITTLLFILTIAFLIYVLTFTQRTNKGNEDYSKWKAFKNFLNDFGRFEEKELPEIKLWEKYLVYATIFGLATKVQKAMKVRFDELHPSYTARDNLFDYMLFSSFTNDFDRTINNSISQSISSVAESKMSSGTGSGGGFSGGSSFGGGGGGHGF